MATIFVRTKPDRIAFADEAGKKRIPSDRYIGVQDSNWVQARLAAGDIEKQPQTAPAASVVGDASSAPPVQASAALPKRSAKT